MPRHLQLNADETEALSRRVNGKVGFQGLLRGLQTGFDDATGILTLSEEQIERIVRYTTRYGWGGFEGRRLEGVRRNLPNLVK